MRYAGERAARRAADGVPAPEAVRTSARELARGIATLGPEDLRPGTLTLPLSVSLWLRRSGADLLTARRAMLAVRGALVESAGMDLGREPVPLLAGDDRTVVLHLTVYLHGLVDRAALARRTTRRRIVERALRSLDVPGRRPAV